MTAESAPRRGPYGEAALALWAAGWRGVLPLPERAKANPPKGFTGADGLWPSYADVHAWTEGVEAMGNVALRLPQHVAGIDVDNYGRKHGAQTLASAVERWGELPRTWRSTSRDDGSGILLFTVPEGLAWPGELPGGDVELLQFRHRYAVVSPSVHPEGRRYRWITPDGATSLTPPSVDELPLLPEAWVAGLTGGLAVQDRARAGLDEPGARAWLTQHADSDQGCRAVASATLRALTDLRTGSRHDAALRATMRLTGLAHEHHTGAVSALGTVREAFLAACAEAGRGTDRDVATAEWEWRSMLAGAVDRTAGRPPEPHLDDPCRNPLAGLIAEQGAQPWSPPASAVTVAGTVVSPTPTGPSSTPSSTPPSTPWSPSASASTWPPPEPAGGAAPADTSGSISGPATPWTPPTPSSSASGAGGSPPDWSPGDASAEDAGGSDQPDPTAGDPERAVLDLARELADPAKMLTEQAQLTATELYRQRARRDATRLLVEQDIAKSWREPAFRATLTDELAVPDEPVAFRVADVMPVGANVLLAAQFKAGKTTTLNQLAGSLVDGTSFLARFAVVPGGRVGIFNYEVDERQYRRWLRDAGIRNTDAISILNLRGFRLDIMSRHGEDWVVRWLQTLEIAIWFLDPFARAFNGVSENDNAEVGRFLDTLDVIKERAGVSELVLATHTGRAVSEIGAERARGATRLDDWADVRWLLARDTETEARYLRATGRDVEVDEGRLDYDPLTRALTFVPGGRVAAGQAAVPESIMRAVAASPGMSQNGLLTFLRNTGTKGRSAEVLAALAGLVSQGLVIKGIGARGAICHWLPSDAPRP